MFCRWPFQLMYLFMKISLRPDIIPNGWLGSKHKLTKNSTSRRMYLCTEQAISRPLEGRWTPVDSVHSRNPCPFRLSDNICQFGFNTTRSCGVEPQSTQAGHNQYSHLIGRKRFVCSDITHERCGNEMGFTRSDKTRPRGSRWNDRKTENLRAFEQAIVMSIVCWRWFFCATEDWKKRLCLFMGDKSQNNRGKRKLSLRVDAANNYVT